jgi:hypothetical protein
MKKQTKYYGVINDINMPAERRSVTMFTNEYQANIYCQDVIEGTGMSAIIVGGLQNIKRYVTDYTIQQLRELA